MKHIKLLAVLAALSLLAGSAFAVAKLVPATVDENRCMGCGACIDTCPAGAVTLNDKGVAVVDEDKCTGCKKCVNACAEEAISLE